MGFSGKEPVVADRVNLGLVRGKLRHGSCVFESGKVSPDVTSWEKMVGGGEVLC